MMQLIQQFQLKIAYSDVVLDSGSCIIITLIFGAFSPIQLSGLSTIVYSSPTRIRILGLGLQLEHSRLRFGLGPFHGRLA